MGFWGHRRRWRLSGGRRPRNLPCGHGLGQPIALGAVFDDLVASNVGRSDDAVVACRGERWVSPGLISLDVAARDQHPRPIICLPHTRPAEHASAGRVWRRAVDQGNALGGSGPVTVSHASRWMKPWSRPPETVPCRGSMIDSVVVMLGRRPRSIRSWLHQLRRSSVRHTELLSDLSYRLTGLDEIEHLATELVGYLLVVARSRCRVRMHWCSPSVDKHSMWW